MEQLERLRQAGWTVELHGFPPVTEDGRTSGDVWECLLLPPGYDDAPPDAPFWPDTSAYTVEEAIAAALQEARERGLLAGEAAP